MKKIIFILLILTKIGSAQDITILYVDNSKSLDRVSLLENQITPILENSENEILFILGGKIDPNDLTYESYNLDKSELIEKLPNLLLQNSDSKSPSKIVDLLEIELEKLKVFGSEENVQFSELGEPKSSVTKSVKIHFYFHISTFTIKKYYENIIQVFLAKNNELINDKFEFIVYLDYPLNDKKDSYDNHILDINNKSNIKIKQYNK